MNTFHYDGAGTALGDVAISRFAVEVPDNTTTYQFGYCDLYVLFGNYIGTGAQSPSSVVEPSFFPTILPSVKARLMLHYYVAEVLGDEEEVLQEAYVGDYITDLTLVAKQDLFEVVNTSPTQPTDKIIGARLTFATPYLEPTSDLPFIVRWEVSPFVVNFGGDLISVPGSSGVGNPFNQED